MRSGIVGVEKKTERADRCENCQFFEADGVGGQGECRIRAPVGVPAPDGRGGLTVVTYWPAARPERWCGEWKRLVDLRPLS